MHYLVILYLITPTLQKPHEILADTQLGAPCLELHDKLVQFRVAQG